jgi:branched-chain amino acid transport system ATP-binding protein
MTLFSTKALTKKFGGVTAVSSVNLAIPEGDIVGLIGPNGAGKTTFFNVISGIMPPTSGDLFFDGRKITGMKPYRITRLGMARTFQNIRLFSGMTTVENVFVARHVRTRAGVFSALFGGRTASREDSQSLEKINKILSDLDLTDSADTPADTLSYGQQRRLEIARALATEPRLLLLDEPSAGMNTRETEELMDMIMKIRSRGITVLLIEHDMNLVMGICEKIVVLDYGRKIAEGTPVEIRNNEEVIEAYLGREQDYEDLG